MITETSLICTTKSGQLVRKPAVLEYRDNRIWFVKSPFELKDEIKAMAGAKWHGFEDTPLKQWSVKDIPRNRIQIEWLEGGNPFEHFEQPVRKFLPEGYQRAHAVKGMVTLYPTQHRMINNALTYHYQIIAGCPGAGKTVSAIEIMERSGLTEWMYVAPKTVLLEIALQFEAWGLDERVKVLLCTYDKLTSLVKSGAYNLPQGIIFDEGSKLKTDGVQRTTAAQEIADKIREVHKLDGYALTMSGTPSPKTPLDIWALAEVTYPGYLREGSPKALEQRIAILKPAERPGQVGGFYNERLGWLDEDGKCKVCGLSKEACKDAQGMDPDSAHVYQPSINEVAHIHKRLEGLMTVVLKSECPPLPEKTYIPIELEPTAKLLKVAAAIARTASSTIQGLNQLRQLSDGFLYRDGVDGQKTCPTCNGTGEIEEWFNPAEPDRPYGSIELMDPEKTKNFEKRKVTCCHCGGTGQVDNVIRETIAVPCPKADCIEELLERAEEDTGRILLFAGFQGSVDRLDAICREAGWDVFRCDGRGSSIIGTDGIQVCVNNPLEYWRNPENKKVAFVANPESGGFGLTLTEANIVVFYSNSYKPEFRLQAEERAHRPGQDNPVKIYDLLHLPSDRRTLELIRDNRRLENMVLGDILGDCFNA